MMIVVNLFNCQQQKSRRTNKAEGQRQWYREKAEPGEYFLVQVDNFCPGGLFLVQVEINQKHSSYHFTGGEDFQVDPGRDPADPTKYRDRKLPRFSTHCWTGCVAWKCWNSEDKPQHGRLHHLQRDRSVIQRKRREARREISGHSRGKVARWDWGAPVLLLLVAKNKIIDIVTVCFRLRIFVIRIVIPTFSHGLFSIVNRCFHWYFVRNDFVLDHKNPNSHPGSLSAWSLQLFYCRQWPWLPLDWIRRENNLDPEVAHYK